MTSPWGAPRQGAGEPLEMPLRLGDAHLTIAWSLQARKTSSWPSSRGARIASKLSASAASGRHPRGPAGSMSPIAGPITSRRSTPHGNWATSSSSAPARTARSRWVPRPRARGGISSRSPARLPAQAHGEVVIPGQGGRPARTAQVALAAAPVWLLVPLLERSVHPDWTAVSAWVERVWEPTPPADVEEPLEWILLSSLPAADAPQLHRRCDWYSSRPLVEDYHQVEKTGCGEERLRFETAEAMLPMLGVLAIVAVRVLQLRWWGRSGGRRRRSRPPPLRNGRSSRAWGIGCGRRGTSSGRSPNWAVSWAASAIRNQAGRRCGAAIGGSRTWSWACKSRPVASFLTSEKVTVCRSHLRRYW